VTTPKNLFYFKTRLFFQVSHCRRDLGCDNSLEKMG